MARSRLAEPKQRAHPVTLILASRPNVYSSSPLDRAGMRREDSAWIEQRLHDPDTLFVPV
jgi:NAD+ diphosphatase